jgi:asparagine synthase (glutamine-hydrolysing)
MCGISGLYLAGRTIRTEFDPAAVVLAMNRTMQHRGPDAEGMWCDAEKRCVLAHRRLSIIDVSDAGRQPMHSASERWVISFNGEIYNFKDLRPLVESHGAVIRGRTDTEVLLAAIELWGTEALQRLDGMFAFAAFDRHSGELVLARDPFGEKPLYYLELPGGGLAFASELQALEEIPGFDRDVCPEALAETLMFQYIGAPRTIYRQVRKIPPGHWLRVKPGAKPHIDRYFSFRPGERGFTSAPIEELADELEDLLTKSIERRMIADVPLGAFLSGGVDSSTTCALIRKKLARPLMTFSIGFEGAQESEHVAARQFARHLGTDHRDDILAPDPSNFLLSLGSILDEPNADSSCLPTYLLSQFARRHVTVAVSGDGGDELFGGYGRYADALSEEKGFPRSDRSPGRSYYAERILIFTERHLEELFGEVPAGLMSHLCLLRSEINQKGIPLLCRLRRTDVDNYMPGAVLPKVDRMSMRHSLEVRTPFLNVSLARFAERLPPDVLCRGKFGKVLLRRVAYRYLPKKLIDAPKRGFGLPMSNWGRQSLLQTLRRLVASDDSRLRESLGSKRIDAFLERQSSPHEFSTYQVWAVAMLESWCRQHQARLPKFEEKSHHGVASRESEPSLLAMHLAGNNFVVCEASSGTPAEGIAVDSARLMALIFSEGMASDVFRPGVHRRESAGIPIPYWGRGLEAHKPSQARPLSGATLFFLDSDAGLRLDVFELDKFSALGVVQVAFFVPYRDDGAVCRLKLNPLQRSTRIANALKLWPLRVASWTPWSCTRRAPYRLNTGCFVGVSGAADTELGHDYMLFEGFRQLPPIPVGHVDVQYKGRGRYSVWNGHCVFSASGMRRLPLSRYWLVPKNENTTRFLKFVPEVRVPSPSRKNYFDALERLATDNALRNLYTATKRIVVLTHALPPGGAERQWIYLALGLTELGRKVDFVLTDDTSGTNGHYLPVLEKSGISPVGLGSDVRALLNEFPIHEAAIDVLSAAGNPIAGKTAALAALLWKLKPAAVIAQLDTPNILAGIAALIAGVPRVVLSFRNYNPSRFSYLNNDWYLDCYRILSRSPRVVFTGNSTLANEDYSRWIGIESNRVLLVPNAMDGNMVKPAASAKADLRRRLGISEEVPVIVGVFRLS